MLIQMKRKLRPIDSPQMHESHKRPITRRDFIAQGFLAGGATLLGGGILSLFANPREAYAALALDLSPALQAACGITAGAGKIPFICFDLAGGGNMAGSNVLVGQKGQLDVLSTAGYSKLGLPGTMIPGAAETTALPGSNGDHTNTQLGLAFHADSAYLRGMQSRMSVTTMANVNGAVIPARSENDTSNNPHNPLYGIQKAGANGQILTLCGSQNSVSGGNSMAPLMMIDPKFQPTKVSQPSDVVGLVDTGQLVGLLSASDATAVLESIYRISKQRMNNNVSTGLITGDQVVKDLVNCGYLKAASVADQFGNVILDPGQDPLIVGSTGIFSDAEWNGGGADQTEFRKTASVMKLVIEGFAGAGCIEMGGYDYHGGMRQEGEVKDFRAGKCMGAVLEFAARKNRPVMMYVFSDGSLSSDGSIDNSVNGRGKGQWVSDNQDTASPFFLVYNPGHRPQIFTGSDGLSPAQHQQLGAFSADGNVMRAGTPGANNVNLLVETVLLNYMALHGEQGLFGTKFPNNGLGNAQSLDRLTALAPICNGTTSFPV
jgi:hypothetical protein